MTPEAFDRATVLTVGQIARIAGVSSSRRMLRLLRAGGVRVLRPGYWHVVERLALKEAMPALYEALIEKLSVQ